MTVTRTRPGTADLPSEVSRHLDPQRRLGRWHTTPAEVAPGEVAR